MGFGKLGIGNSGCYHCDTDNTATSVKKNNNDNQENCATDEDSACTMTLTVPNAIKQVVIFKNGKRYCLEI